MVHTAAYHIVDFTFSVGIEVTCSSDHTIWHTCVNSLREADTMWHYHGVTLHQVWLASIGVAFDPRLSVAYY